MESKMSTILYNHHLKTIPSNILKINLSSLGIDKFIMTHGIMKILINLIFLHQKEGMWPEMIL